MHACNSIMLSPQTEQNNVLGVLAIHLVWLSLWRFLLLSGLEKPRFLKEKFLNFKLFRL